MLADVLEQATVEGDVDELLAATDAEHRQAGVSRPAGERELDRPHRCPRRTGRSQPCAPSLQDPLGGGNERALGTERGAQRAADRLERGFGNVMRILARRLEEAGGWDGV